MGRGNEQRAAAFAALESLQAEAIDLRREHFGTNDESARERHREIMRQIHFIREWIL